MHLESFGVKKFHILMEKKNLILATRKFKKKKIFCESLVQIVVYNLSLVF